MRFSFIIPTVKQTTLVRDCIASIRKYELDRSEYEIIVVEDGSDASIQNWLRDLCDREGVRLFLKKENRGFAHTVNIGLMNARGEYLILFNNDVQLIKPILKPLFQAFIQDEKIGVVGAKLLYPDMRIQHAGLIRAPRSSTFLHVNKHQPRSAGVVCKSKYFIGVTGALFAIRRWALDSIGPLNENYFLAYEDTEYCLRAWQAGWRVYYAAEVEAIHQEGGTRGNTDDTKMKKGPQWFLKERETHSKFVNDFKKFDVERFESWVANLNQGKPTEDILPDNAKLQIGSGINPLPGYLHLDRRSGLPDLQYTCDFAHDPLPFEQSKVAEIVANHSLGQVSYRRMPFVLGEWYRVLKPGGRIVIRTPSLEFVARTYLEGKTTPEWPDDEKFIVDNLGSKVTAGWWANIKFFAGQDSPANFNYVCFDFDMLKGLLEKVGFERVNLLDMKPVYSPGELQVEAFKAESSVKNVSATHTTILVRRSGALGDVILTTPIVRRLREQYGREAKINVATSSGAAYLNNPYIDGVFPANHPMAPYDKVIDLDLCYERVPEKHIIDAYSLTAFGDANYDKSTDLIAAPSDFETIEQRLAEAGVESAKAVVVHMAVTWKNRTWPQEYWRQTVDLIVKAGYTVIQIGSGSDFVFPVRPGLVDFTKTITLHQIAALISRCGCFLGNDSGVLHVAGTTKTPIVGIFTSALAIHRVPFRSGSYGHDVTVIEPDIACRGCHHKEPPPVVYSDCRRGDFACLGMINPERVADAVAQAMNKGSTC